MKNYYKEETFEFPKNENTNGCILKGDSWQVFLTEKGYVLEYISGELAGRLKSLSISDQDLEQLRDKTITVEDLLIKYSKN